MKKCLLITTNFPPLQGSGTKRTAAISKYLTRLGWSVFVLTIENDYYRWSPGDEKYVPRNVKVIKTKMLFPKSYFVSGGLSSIFKFFIAGIIHYALLPDRFLSWIPYGYKKGVEIINKEKIDVLYSTAPYFSSHVLAMLLKNKTKLPWLAEFRDSWSKNPEVLKKNFLKRKIEKSMEKKVVEKSDAIATISNFLTKEIMSTYPNMPRNNFYTVTNGFDRENYLDCKSQASNDVFTICYTGNFYYRINSLNNFILAINDLIKNGEVISQKIKIDFFGNFPQNSAKLIKRYNIEDVINYGCSISQEQSLIEQSKSHLLLFFDNDQSYGIGVPAKLYEYLGSEKPIMALTYDGTLCYKIMKNTNAGFVVLDNNIEDIKRIVLRAYQDFYKNGRLDYSPYKDKVNKYNYDNLTIKIDEIFKKISKNH